MLACQYGMKCLKQLTYLKKWFFFLIWQIMLFKNYAYAYIYTMHAFMRNYSIFFLFSFNCMAKIKVCHFLLGALLLHFKKKFAKVSLKEWTYRFHHQWGYFYLLMRNAIKKYIYIMDFFIFPRNKVLKIVKCIWNRIQKIIKAHLFVEAVLSSLQERWRTKIFCYRCFFVN